MAVGTMVHQMSQGDPQGLGAHAGPPSLRPHLPFHHSEGPGRRKPGHGRGMVWPGRGTQGRTDLGLCWAPHPVTTTLGVYKVLGIIVGFWQKAMEPKSLRMVFKEKTSLKIHSVPRHVGNWFLLLLDLGNKWISVVSNYLVQE